MTKKRNQESDDEVEEGERVKSGTVSIGRFPDFLYRKPRMNKFSLEKFSRDAPVDITITGIGKRRSGKTEWLKWVLLRGFRQELPWGWTFTKTKHNKQFMLFMPGRYIIPNFSADMLEQIKRRQVKAIELYLKNPDFNPRTFVIWDDYNGYDIIYNQALKDYYMTGRHFKTFNMFFIQYKNQLPPAVRDNTDYLVLWNSDNLMNIEQYWMQFAGKMSKESFFNMFNEFTEKVEHGFIFIDTDVTKDYNDKFFYGKAELVKCGIDTIVGCEQYWRQDMKQLQDIRDGKIEHEYQLLNELSYRRYNQNVGQIPPQIINESKTINSNQN